MALVSNEHRTAFAQADGKPLLLIVQHCNVFDQAAVQSTALLTVYSTVMPSSGLLF
jgi:hypothetical protein